MARDVRRKGTEKNRKQTASDSIKLNKTDDIKERKNANRDTSDKKKKTDTLISEKRKLRGRGISERSIDRDGSDNKKIIKRKTDDNKKSTIGYDNSKDFKRSTVNERKNTEERKKIKRKKKRTDNTDKEKTSKKPVRNKNGSGLRRKSEVKADNKKKIKEAGIIAAIMLLMVFTYNVFGRSYIDRMERQDFIDTMEPMAAELYEEYGILPSITISQSAVESNWGQSKLSKKGFNLFELKADDSWNGGTINLYTKEENNKSGEVEYRKYGSYKEALYDHVEYILKDKDYKESELFKSKDYREQAKELEKYEKTNENSDKRIYDDIIIDTIEKYNLDDIDRKYK